MDDDSELIDIEMFSDVLDKDCILPVLKLLRLNELSLVEVSLIELSLSDETELVELSKE